MKRNGTMKPHAICPLAFALALGAGIAPVQAANFTYHGDLMDGDAAASGAYDLRVRAFGQPGASKALADATELPGVKLVDGRFSVELDLPEDPDGTTWVEVAVRKAGSGGAFETLGDPQPISKANSTCPGAWALDGNSGMPAGSFLGTVDYVPLRIRVGNQPIAELTQFIGLSAPNINFGRENLLRINGTSGATISGGGPFNLVTDTLGTVAGGVNNTAGDDSNTGQDSDLNASHATVSGGAWNQAGGKQSVVPGGIQNCAGGDHSFAAGRRAKVRRSRFLIPTISGCAGVPSSETEFGDIGTFVWADSQDVDFVSSGPNQYLIRAEGGVGINTATFGNAVNLRNSELMIKNPDAGGNVDLTLITQANRGYNLVVVPGAGGAAGDFYIGETDARTSSVGFTNRFMINAAGTTFVQGGAVGNLSDARLKKNFAPIARPLDTLLALNGQMFEYIDPVKSMNAPGLRMGFVAQDVQKVLPQWVRPTGAEGYLAVTPIGFEALAVEAIRDLKSEYDLRVETLESENAALSTRVVALERAMLTRFAEDRK